VLADVDVGPAREREAERLRLVPDIDKESEVEKVEEALVRNPLNDEEGEIIV